STARSSLRPPTGAARRWDEAQSRVGPCADPAHSPAPMLVVDLKTARCGAVVVGRLHDPRHTAKRSRPSALAWSAIPRDWPSRRAPSSHPAEIVADSVRTEGSHPLRLGVLRRFTR